MRAELIPISGGPPLTITKDITVVGRRDYCDIQLDDPSVSKRHCVLIKTDGLLMIRDLATTNGTKVKGQMIRWAALLPDDRVTIGKVKFRVFLGPDRESEPKLSARSSRSKERSTKRPAKVVVALSPAPQAPVAERDEPVDLGDSRWFDRVSLANLGDEEIIDLD